MVLAAEAVSPRRARRWRSPSTAQRQTGALYRTSARRRWRDGRELANAGSAPAQVVVTVSGHPADAGACRVAGLYHRAQLLQARRHAGRPLHVRQNDRLVVALKVTETEAKLARLLLVDLLPAGLEIDNPNLVDGTGACRPALAEARRRARRQPSIATTASSRPSTAQPEQPAFFTLAYIVRARGARAATCIRPRRSRTCTAPSASAARPSARSRSRGGSDARACAQTSGAIGCGAGCAAGARRLRLRVAAVGAARRCGASSTSSGRSICRRLPQGSTVVLDRDGRLLRAFTTADGRWRLPVTSADVDPRFLAMLLAYRGPPLHEPSRRRRRSPWCERRGRRLRDGRIVSGGSTLTMQVARLLEPREERSLAAKLRQMVRAVQLEQRLQQGPRSSISTSRSRPMAAMWRDCARPRSPISARSRSA